MKTTGAELSLRKYLVLAILLMAVLLSLVSCESKVGDATRVLIEEFEDIWETSPLTFTDVERFTMDTVYGYYLGFDCVDEDDGATKHVNAIIIVDSATKMKEEYIHSTSFEADEHLKGYYDAYLAAKDSGELDIFSAEEIQKIQQKLEKELG